jgi:hypothetical protein
MSLKFLPYHFTEPWKVNVIMLLSEKIQQQKFRKVN